MSSGDLQMQNKGRKEGMPRRISLQTHPFCILQFPLITNPFFKTNLPIHPTEPKPNNAEPITNNHELSIPILADRPPSRPPRPRQFHLASVTRMHGPAPRRRASHRHAKAQRVHLPRQWRPFAQLPDHRAGQWLQVLTFAKASGEAPQCHHTHQRSASPGQPQPPPQLH